MTPHPGPGRHGGFAPHRYRTAALAACTVFSLLELGVPWTAGPQRADMQPLPGRFAEYLAGLHYPAMPPGDASRKALAFQWLLGGDALLVALLAGLLWYCVAAGRRPASALTIPLALQILLATLLCSPAFDVLVAAQLAALLPLRRGLAWLATLFVAGAVAGCWNLYTDARMPVPPDMLPAVCALLVGERTVVLLAFGLAWLARREWRGRLLLASANAQLRATQSLLNDTVRGAERTRIARDLHDAIGHHLTALHLHLDLASRQAGAMPGSALGTARELAQSLLAEVRSVVNAERQVTGVNLPQALELLCAGIPSPAITLHIGGGIDACPPGAAYTLLCCVQEAITNAVRHAQAERLSIDVHCAERQIVTHIADNGRGHAGGNGEGNGLSGIRERLAEHGGLLRTGGAGQPGYWLEFTLPFDGAVA